MSTKTHSATEVAKHNHVDDLWLIIHGKVYDVTKFQDDHPGGADSLLEHAGKDATSEFEEIFHTVKARKDIDKYCVGMLEGYTGDPDAIMKSGGAVGANGVSSMLVGIPLLIVLFAFLYQFVLTE